MSGNIATAEFIGALKSSFACANARIAVKFGIYIEATNCIKLKIITYFRNLPVEASKLVSVRLPLQDSMYEPLFRLHSNHGAEICYQFKDSTT